MKEVGFGNRLMEKIRCLMSGKKAQKEIPFDKIVSLGYNCEVSFRIEDFTHRPIDSYPYSWSYALDQNLFVESLWHPGDILRGSVEVLPWGMFLDEKYQLSFHGKETGKPLFLKEGELDQMVADQMVAELRSRVAHLAEKFEQLLKSNHYTLFIMKIPSWKNGEENTKLIEKVCEFLEQNYLSGKYILLAVAERGNQSFREHTDELEAYEKLRIRYINEFAPDDDVKNSGDIQGWLDAIGAMGTFLQ